MERLLEASGVEHPRRYAQQEPSGRDLDAPAWDHVDLDRGGMVAQEQLLVVVVECYSHFGICAYPSPIPLRCVGAGVTEEEGVGPVAVAVVEALKAAGLSYAVGGALALGVWGVPRSTTDVDIDAFISEERYKERLDAPGGFSRSSCSAATGRRFPAARSVDIRAPAACSWI